MKLEQFKQEYIPREIDTTQEDYRKYLINGWPQSSVLIKTPDDCIWTIIKEDDKIFIKNGLHFLGRLGNLITEKPYTKEDKFKIEVV